MSSIIVLAFTGTGKTTYCEQNSDCIDIDASTIPKRPFFALNYYIEIKKALNKKYKYIFISTHKEIRNLLKLLKINYIIIYPEISLKDEYYNRFINRGNSTRYANLIAENWDTWINEMEKEKNVNKYVLKSNMYISDIINKL